tara:strand:- start:188 stop:436 length:249 start_codon:yes stop_codon:yes gene_type:complete
MASFARKIKRKRFVADRKQFMKHFKKSMKKFKAQVKCSSCGRPPNQGENIDEWHIDQESDNINLVCPECIQLKNSGLEVEDV